MSLVSPGKWADLVLLDADPSADIRNTRRIRAVMQAARLLDREAPDAVLTAPSQPSLVYAERLRP